MKLQILNIPRLALRRRGSALLGLVTVGILWAGVALMFQRDLQQDYASVINRNENYALLFQENVLRSLGELDKTLLYLRRRVETLKDTTDYQRIVESTDVQSDIIVQVAITDSKGIAWASNAVKQLTKPIDISDREHFKFQVNNTSDTLFISKPVIGRASGKWSVQLTRRYVNKDGTFAGVVVASMDPAYFTGFYDQIKLGTDTSVAMIGGDGVVRSEGGGAIPQVALGQDLSGTDLFKRLQNTGDWDLRRTAFDGAGEPGCHGEAGERISSLGNGEHQGASNLPVRLEQPLAKCSDRRVPYGSNIARS